MYELEYRFRRSDDGLYDQNRSRGDYGIWVVLKWYFSGTVNQFIPGHRHIGPYASFVRRHGRLPDDGDLQGGFYDVCVAAVCKCLLLPERKEYGAAGWWDIYRDIEDADVQE